MTQGEVRAANSEACLRFERATPGSSGAVCCGLCAFWFPNVGRLELDSEGPHVVAKTIMGKCWPPAKKEQCNG